MTLVRHQAQSFHSRQGKRLAAIYSSTTDHATLRSVLASYEIDSKLSGEYEAEIFLIPLFLYSRFYFFICYSYLFTIVLHGDQDPDFSGRDWHNLSPFATGLVVSS